MKDEDIRIAHIISPLTWRGGEQQAVYLYEELARLGIEQVFVCPKQSTTENYCLEKAFRYYSLPRAFGLDPRFASGLAKICRNNRIRFMHAHDSGAHSFAVLSKDLFRNPASIILQRRVDFPVSRSRFSRYKYNHPSIRKILCVSMAIRHILEPDIRDHEKLAVVYEGVDIHKFAPRGGTKLREQYQVPADHLLIGNVAALSEQKDYFTFADTVKILEQHAIPATYFAIGSGPDEPEIKAYVHSLGLQDRIIFTGFRNDIPQILPELDILLFSSQTEGLGTTIIDAFAAGVPVVATNAGGIPELIQHQATGYLGRVSEPHTLASGILEAIRDPAKRQAWAANGLERARLFTKENTARETLKVYRSL